MRWVVVLLVAMGSGCVPPQPPEVPLPPFPRPEPAPLPIPPPEPAPPPHAAEPADSGADTTNDGATDRAGEPSPGPSSE
jgi:hypothetical protein